MGVFERYLSLWVSLAIAAGIGAGNLVPQAFAKIADFEFAQVNLIVALLIWLMIYPMMLKVKPSCLGEVRSEPKGLYLTIAVNWLVKPFTMAGLGILFFQYIYGDMVSSDEAQQYIAGMILLGIAPCTAMVFVWSNLSEGDANYTLVQVTVNDLILVFAFAPLAGLLLGVTDLHVPWDTLAISVLTFVVIPLGAALVTRSILKSGKESASASHEERIEGLAESFKSLSIASLLLTVALLFAFQAEAIVENPLSVVLIAIPLLIQSYGIFAIAYGSAKFLKLPHKVAAPAAMIGTSNFFELAVAVAISLFGLSSPAALATVVGVLIEVPVMLSLVAFAGRTRHWFASDSSA